MKIFVCFCRIRFPTLILLLPTFHAGKLHFNQFRTTIFEHFRWSPPPQYPNANVFVRDALFLSKHGFSMFENKTVCQLLETPHKKGLRTFGGSIVRHLFSIGSLLWLSDFVASSFVDGSLFNTFDDEYFRADNGHW